jgi:queuosine precursor transporter
MFPKLQSTKIQICLAIYIAIIIVVNLAGAKTTTLSIFNNPITFSVSLLIFPIISTIQDSITEVFGRELSRKFLYMALFVSFITAGFLTIATLLPPSSRYIADDSSYKLIFGQSIRILVASQIAFLISDLLDIAVFQKVREYTKGKYLLLRTNLSNILSEIIDTFLFMYIAFLGISPKYTAEFVFSIAVTYMITKVIWNMINSPLVNVVVGWLRSSNE